MAMHFLKRRQLLRQRRHNGGGHEGGLQSFKSPRSFVSSAPSFLRPVLLAITVGVMIAITFNVPYGFHHFHERYRQLRFGVLPTTATTTPVTSPHNDDFNDPVFRTTEVGRKTMEELQKYHQRRQNGRDNHSPGTPGDGGGGDDGFVHVVSTRFMQYQPNLLSMGRARVYQFETFCLPTMAHQTSQNFVWLIRTDPQLAAPLLDHLQRILQPYPNFYLLLDNNNTIHEFTPYRDLFQHHQGHGQSSTIVTGSIPLLQRHVSLSQYAWNLETAVDSDDGLHETFIEKIQQRARRDRSALMGMNSDERVQTSLLQQQQQNSASIVDPTKDRIQYLYCATTSILWYSSTMSNRVPYDPTKPNTTINTPPDGLLRRSGPPRKRGGKTDYGMCIQLGLTHMLSPALPKRLSIPHNEIHSTVRLCRDVLQSVEGLLSTKQSNQVSHPSGSDDNGTDNTFETTMRCLNWLQNDEDGTVENPSSIKWPPYQTLRSRAVTSDGMGGFHKSWEDDPNSVELRTSLYSEFHVPPQLVVEAHSYFRSHQLDIMKDNIAGQCTPFEPRGATCKQDYPTKTLKKYMAEVERKENAILSQETA
mmetsp:Transcript_40803/g.97772  ORF Transcript_40803/g.97772 Transcript_40803/m.97772 type:complete len:588 (+) Transcript_40803:181-1944(+)|eukprot:CAMPEP_0113446776 /NCGR_PEP_ID=MMETSP0014_2-20120614/3891_1 /TAXON_ID=2857 /ORGANISM="Nitzschia sp." /LENGTH=587 /DNA_ID=CAMNT_0000337899 /DNA_START=85 /DNA_END=1848 /DNA_ORIENTATION=- /assembly_acc=CAM_ASM_000159